MNKSLIRVIKRRAEVAAEICNEPEVPVDPVKAARLAKREMIKTVTGWISELREQTHLAEIIARRSIYGEPLADKG